MNSTRIRKTSKDYYWLVAGFIFLLGMRLTAPTSLVAYIILAIYAFRGPKHVIRALIGSWFLTLANPGVFPDVPSASPLRYVVLFACAASVALRTTRNKRRTKQVVGPATALLAGLIFIQIVSLSNVLLPSALKLISWTIGVLTLLAAWRRLDEKEERDIKNEIYIVLGLLILFSLPLLLSGAGFLRNGRGFQGLMNHPQPFGITAGLLATWAFVRTIRLEPPLKWHVFLGLLALTCTVLSQARTALLSMAIALLLSTVLFVSFNRQRMVEGGRVSRNSGAMMALVLFGLAVGASLSARAGQFSTFLTKNQNVEAAGIGEAFTASRGFLVDRMMMNIGISPWTGIGFGSPSDPTDFAVELDPIFGLPIGAPVEKGVGPVAVLEELGIILTTFFLVWLIIAVRRAWRNGYVPFAIAIFVLSSNMGEYTFFSLGGMGLLLMILFTGSIREQNN